MPPRDEGSITPLSASVLPLRVAAWWMLALALMLGSAFPYLESMMNANERPRILQAIAFVDTGELAVDGPGARGIDPGIDVARSPVDGRLYPNKPPGTSVAAAIAWVIARAGDGPIALRDVTRSARMIGGLLPTLLLCGFLLRRLGRTHHRAVVVAAVVLYAVATPVASYARLLFGHQLAACLLFVGTAFSIDAMRSSVPRRALVLAFAGGLLAGAAVTVEYTAAFAGVPLGAWMIWRARHDRRLAPVAVAVAGALVPIALLALYHTAVFGHPLSTGYHHVVDPGFAQIHARGLLGLSWPTLASLHEHLVSPWGGLLYWAPLVPLAVGVSLARFRRLTEDERLFAVIFVVMLVVTLGLSQSGGWRVGPRYLVVAFPFAVPAIARLLESAREHVLACAGVVALAGWSAAINLLAAHLFPHLVPEGNPLADLLLPLLLEGFAPHDVLASIVGGPRAALVLGLVLGMGAVGLSLAAVVPVGSRARVLGLGAVAAVLVFGAALRLPAGRDAESTLVSVQSIWEPRPGGSRVTIEIGDVDPSLHRRR
jgi:hypothetical protein